ncbi:MAG TPA: RNase III inhibitor [Saprospirales bacterium]|nr:RNase III inhibitor [Saprospirales bacterium]
MKINIILDDITKLKTDAIVNAANRQLAGGGGVDGAIHKAGGSAILEECRQIGYCETGKAVVTTAGNLLSRYLIHTVGPIWHEHPALMADLLLSLSYRNSLLLADHLDCKSLAFPNISTGVYGFPKDRAAELVKEVVQHFEPEKLEILTFCCFDQENYDIYNELFKTF